MQAVFHESLQRYKLLPPGERQNHTADRNAVIILDLHTRATTGAQDEQTLKGALDLVKHRGKYLPALVQ